MPCVAFCLWLFFRFLVRGPGAPLGCGSSIVVIALQTQPRTRVVWRGVTLTCVGRPKRREGPHAISDLKRREPAHVDASRLIVWGELALTRAA